MRRIQALIVLLAALTATEVGAQLTDQTLVPRGRLRVGLTPSFTAWDSRYGSRVEGGSVVEEEEDLGSDFTDPAGAIFPGIAALEEQIRALSGDPSFSGITGSSRASLSKDVTRLELGIHLGVFDWLTVGAVVPWVENRTALHMAFRPDTVGGTLGLNPLIEDNAGVSAFLEGLENAQAAAQGRADALCGADPTSAACTDAQGLATSVTSFHATTFAAYFASGLFPMQGTPMAETLAARTAELDQALVDAGVPGIGTGMVFATQWLDDASFVDLPATGGSFIQGGPLRSVESLWVMGDIEVSALARIAEGEIRDSATAPARYSYSLAAGVMTRLGTGKVDTHGNFLDMGSGDGQVDIEGQLFGFLGVGSRLGVRAGVRYGVQQSTNLLRRVGTPDEVIRPFGTLRAVTWTPGSYLGVELEPVWRLTEALSLFGSYRMYSKGSDSYELFGAEPEGGLPVNVADLELETEVTLHQAGLGLRYATTSLWARGEAGSPMEVHARVLYAAGGSGGQTPVSTRVEFGVKIFRGIWGGGPNPDVN